jgi:nucleotidyltransferase/DNA polymerase involved in DNA repair
MLVFSVEERDQPALKDKPMAVGGMGMICTANYVARKFGVRSAMPGFIAKKLCPQVRSLTAAAAVLLQHHTTAIQAQYKRPPCPHRPILTPPQLPVSTLC